MNENVTKLPKFFKWMFKTVSVINFSKYFDKRVVWFVCSLGAKEVAAMDSCFS